MRVGIGFEAKREVVCLIVHPMEGIRRILVAANLICVVVGLISLKIDFALPLQTGASSPQMLSTLSSPQYLPALVIGIPSDWPAVLIFGIFLSPSCLLFLAILFSNILF